ncbi:MULTISPECIES: hypothetical protein [Nitratireductor]|uniref:hypothetical protein n=1 Tax=Nitratireductor TaxID=245876 RepID=UPI000D0CF698|nr:MULTISPECIES: hypothetical protein [Nitratireductor]PSM15914.1 hypothetical protein C7T96_22860 [Nitratireductor sp. StC3]
MTLNLDNTKRLAAAAALASFTLAFTGSAHAGSYKLSCVDSVTGQSVSVTVEASSRAAAIDKVRNDPAYSNYDKCQ